MCLTPQVKSNFQEEFCGSSGGCVQEASFRNVSSAISSSSMGSTEGKAHIRHEQSGGFAAAHDGNRVLTSRIKADFTLRIKGQMREWNEEYQTCKELPSETIQERITRDRALVKINCDFVEAAIKGAWYLSTCYRNASSAIVEKTVPPLNPLDPERAHMYLYNNIFFSYAMDSRDLFKEYGGDKAAYVSVNNDLKGIKLMNRVVRGLVVLC